MCGINGFISQKFTGSEKLNVVRKMNAPWRIAVLITMAFGIMKPFASGIADFQLSI